MEMLIGGSWRAAASGRTEDVTSPFDGAVIGTVPVADAGDVRAALDRAEQGAITWRRTPAFERMTILARAAELADAQADAGTVHINWTPPWLADLMPYGGLKASGIGKEGPRSAVAEMTDTKTVILHGRPW
jgi:acyl-CoA reductase-like NAD-dependent aldehyde dehydrogenase